MVYPDGDPVCIGQHMQATFLRRLRFSLPAANADRVYEVY
jgi:hypothetical protein